MIVIKKWVCVRLEGGQGGKTETYRKYMRRNNNRCI